jgi:hypothetical protein
MAGTQITSLARMCRSIRRARVSHVVASPGRDAGSLRRRRISPNCACQRKMCRRSAPIRSVISATTAVPAA